MTINEIMFSNKPDLKNRWVKINSYLERYVDASWSNIRNINVSIPYSGIVRCEARDTKGDLIFCSYAEWDPETVYDYNILAKQAVENMYKDYDVKPVPRVKFNGQLLVCWSETESSLYDVVDGQIKTDRKSGAEHETIYSDASENMMKKALCDAIATKSKTCEYIVRMPSKNEEKR